MDNALNYWATDTARDFHLDNSEVRLLLGPVGCGKSVAACMEIMMRAATQEPGNDGIRRTRWAIVRNTYPELKATTIKTWTSWFPEEKFGKIKYDSPITQHIRINDIDMEVFFLSLDKESDIKKLKSFELTGVYINELQFIDELIFLTCRERTNRYPAKKEGVKATWTGVIADANPPPTQHWMYDAFEKNCPSNYKIFRYEPALIKVDSVPNGTMGAISKNGTVYISNPKADYVDVQNDPFYWLKLVSGNNDEKIKVDLLGQYGVVISGRPVHPAYNDNLHHANKALVYNPALPLILAFDFGLTPACAFMQLTPLGKLQVIDELWSIHMHLRDFANNVVVPHLNMHYPDWRNDYRSFHDPAGSTGSQTDGQNCEDILKEAGIISEPAADNNDPTARRDGLNFFLSRMTGGEPAFALSNKCKMIREGLMGHFQYARLQVGGEARFHEKPHKNIYSHICEALEYGAMFCAATNKKPPVSNTKPNRRVTGSFMAL